MRNMNADDVILKKKPCSPELSVLDEMILWSRNKPLTREELAAFGPAEKKADNGLTLRPYFTVKCIEGAGGKLKFVPFVGIKGTF